MRPNEQTAPGAQVIVVASQKGGVGKTTVALNLALAFAERGLRTLLLDLDPQGAIGHSLNKGDVELAGIADILAGSVEAEEAVIPTTLSGLSLLPRGRLDPIDVSAFEVALGGEKLQEIIGPILDGFERVVVDTPAGLGLVTRAALKLAQFVLIPAQAEPLALSTIHQLLRLIEHVHDNENPELQLLGVLPTMVDLKVAPSHAVLMELWDGFPGVLETIIPRAPVFAEASAQGVPLAYLGGPPAPEAKRFDLLADEIAHVITRLSGIEESQDDRPARQLL